MPVIGTSTGPVISHQNSSSRCVGQAPAYSCRCCHPRRSATGSLRGARRARRKAPIGQAAVSHHAGAPSSDHSGSTAEWQEHQRVDGSGVGGSRNASETGVSDGGPAGLEDVHRQGLPPARHGPAASYPTFPPERPETEGEWRPTCTLMPAATPSRGPSCRSAL